MKILPILGALAFVVLGQFAIRAYGTAGGVVIFVLMAAAWWGSYVWKERVLDRVWREFSALPHEKQIEILKRSDEAFCDAMVKRDWKKKPIQSSQPTRGKAPRG